MTQPSNEIPPLSSRILSLHRACLDFSRRRAEARSEVSAGEACGSAAIYCGCFVWSACAPAHGYLGAEGGQRAFSGGDLVWRSVEACQAQRESGLLPFQARGAGRGAI